MQHTEAAHIHLSTRKAILSFFAEKSGESAKQITQNKDRRLPGRGEQVSTTSITELSRHPDRKYVAQPEVDAPMRSGNWPPFIGHERALTVSAVKTCNTLGQIYCENNAVTFDFLCRITFINKQLSFCQKPTTSYCLNHY